MIQERYRRDYDGEFVIVNTVFRDGQKHQEREWVANPIENQHLSGRAVVVCDTKKILSYDPKLLKKHKGGLLGKKKLQTYGIHKVWKDLTCDFLVSLDFNNLKEIVESNYDELNIVYTNARYCIQQPGHFYLIPHGVKNDDTSVACYLAAFDGHQEIFIINFEQWESTKACEYLSLIFQAYPATKFIFVSLTDRRSDLIKNCPNTSYMYVDEWVSYCDV